MTPSTAYTISETHRRQLRDLNAEYRDLNETINHAQASVDRAKKLNDINYHRRRKAILSNGHAELEE
jgi:hypothetical protein